MAFNTFLAPPEKVKQTKLYKETSFGWTTLNKNCGESNGEKINKNYYLRL